MDHDVRVKRRLKYRLARNFLARSFKIMVHRRYSVSRQARFLFPILLLLLLIFPSRDLVSFARAVYRFGKLGVKPEASMLGKKNRIFSQVGFGSVDILYVIEEISSLLGWLNYVRGIQELANRRLSLLRGRTKERTRLERLWSLVKNERFEEARLQLNAFRQAHGYVELIPGFGARVGQKNGLKAPLIEQERTSLDRDSEWEDFIKGRNLIIVGPAPDPEIPRILRDLGERDVVVWIGAVNEGILSGALARGYGVPRSKSVVVFNGANARWLASNADMFNSTAYIWTLLKAPVSLVSVTNQRTLRPGGGFFLSGSPNLLQALLGDLLLYAPGSITVCGADFFVGQTRYREESIYSLPTGGGLQKIDPLGHVSGFNSFWIDQAHHNLSENRSYVKYLFAAGLVDGSRVFRETLEISAADYLETLQVRFDSGT